MKIEIDIACQTLTVFEGDVLEHTYPISSGANGVGEQNGSLCTPRGKHIVRAKIGAGAEQLFSSEEFISNPMYKMIYHQDRVFIFALDKSLCEGSKLITDG